MIQGDEIANIKSLMIEIKKTTIFILIVRPTMTGISC